MNDRHSIRLPGHDYTQPAAYFVTVCTDGRRCVLGRVNEGVVELNVSGFIVGQSWLEVPNHFPDVQLDASVVMPNHVHGIIFLRDARATHASPGRDIGDRSWTTRVSPLRPKGAASGSIGAIVGASKSAAARRINARRRTPGVVVWQRDYYEHIVRDEDELNRIRQYIVDNPMSWDRDPENPLCIVSR